MAEVQVDSKQLEEAREFWRGIAVKNDWASNPFYVQVWVDEAGNVVDSVSTREMDRDHIVLDDGDWS